MRKLLVHAIMWMKHKGFAKEPHTITYTYNLVILVLCTILVTETSRFDVYINIALRSSEDISA